jgi:hypothetical protein
VREKKEEAEKKKNIFCSLGVSNRNDLLGNFQCESCFIHVSTPLCSSTLIAEKRVLQKSGYTTAISMYVGLAVKFSYLVS